MPITYHADLPTGASARPPSFSFYWAALAITVVALLCLVAVCGARNGRGLMDAWMLVMLLCMVALAMSLPMLVPRWARRRAGRVVVASALGSVSFVGFGFASDEYRSRPSRAPAAAHGVALPAATVRKDTTTPAADEGRR